MYIADQITGRLVCLDAREQSQLEVDIGPRSPAPYPYLDPSTQDRQYWSRFRERHNGTDVEYYLVDADSPSPAEESEASSRAIEHTRKRARTSQLE